MQMGMPLHPGAVIEGELEELGVSVMAAAEALGISRQQLHRVLSGRNAVSPELAIRLEKGLGSTAEAWLRMQANYDLAQLRPKAATLNVLSLVPVRAV